MPHPRDHLRVASACTPKTRWSQRHTTGRTRAVTSQTEVEPSREVDESADRNRKGSFEHSITGNGVNRLLTLPSPV